MTATATSGATQATVRAQELELRGRTNGKAPVYESGVVPVNPRTVPEMR